MFRKVKKIIILFILALIVCLLPVSKPQHKPKAEATFSISGKAHIQSYGDVEGTWDGTTFRLGTIGEGKRLESIQINFQNSTGYVGAIQYRTHRQTYGWDIWRQSYWMNSESSGTNGESKRIEGIQIRLVGEIAEHYSIRYRVHAQTYGWEQGWQYDGALAGTTGESKRLECVEIQLVPKTEKMDVSYRVHRQTYGWEKTWANSGDVSGTVGQSKRLEGINISLTGNEHPGYIYYRTHVQTYGWMKNADMGDMSGTQGEAKRLEAIEIGLEGEVADYYDIYYRVHSQTYGWLGWAKNGEPAGTAGLAKRLEAIQIVLVKKGEGAPATTYNGVTQTTDSPYVNPKNIFTESFSRENQNNSNHKHIWTYNNSIVKSGSLCHWCFSDISDYLHNRIKFNDCRHGNWSMPHDWYQQPSLFICETCRLKEHRHRWRWIKTEYNDNSNDVSVYGHWKCDGCGHISSDGINPTPDYVIQTSENGIHHKFAKLLYFDFENSDVVQRVESCEEPDNSMPLQKITAKVDTLALSVGETYKMEVEYTPLDTTSDKTLTWTSSNPDIISVDANGNITAKKEGFAKIKIEGANYTNFTCYVRGFKNNLGHVKSVKLMINGVDVTGKTVDLEYGKEYNIDIVTDPVGAYYATDFSVEDITVSDNDTNRLKNAYLMSKGNTQCTRSEFEEGNFYKSVERAMVCAKGGHGKTRFKAKITDWHGNTYELETILNVK